jgi:trans-aconitate 2-methyltransferase
MSWLAKQYVTFEDERTRPVRDLSAAVAFTNARSVVDIGSGPGNSTEVLAARFPTATVQGFDTSSDMSAAARAGMPHVRFHVLDVEAWSDPGPFDVILANAVLQWIPHHRTLLPALVGKLSPGGSLAVQMPDNLDEPAHRLMRDLAADGPWTHKLAAAAGTRTPMAGADWYYSVLRESCAKVDIWRTTYYHALPGGPAYVVEWFKGSGLRPFLDPLDDVERTAYLERYQAAVGVAYGPHPDGSILLPFPRLFMVATLSPD